jgi:hypothetical protein
MMHQQNPTALENSLNALEALQVGFKSVLRSHCMQLEIYLAQEISSFSSWVSILESPFFHFFILFLT